MRDTIPRQAAIDAIAALKFNDARTPTELAHNAALSEAMAATLGRASVQTMTTPPLTALVCAEGEK